MLMLAGATFLGGSALCAWNVAPTAAAMAPAAAPAPGMTAAFGARAQDSVQVVKLAIAGMTCGGCTLATRKVLARLEGVQKAVVTYDPPRAIVTFDPAEVTVERMIAAIDTLGYRATVDP